MFKKKNRLYLIAGLISFSVLAPGAWWLLNGRLVPEEKSQAAGSAPFGMEAPGFTPRVKRGRIGPVRVNLADIPPRQFDANNKFSRWLRGKVDFSKRNRIVSVDRFNNLKKTSTRLTPSFVFQDADFAGPSTLAPESGGGFDSLDYTECCGGGGAVPPDGELAVGLTHLIAVVNAAFEIYDKSGATKRQATTFESFMNANSDCTNVFDPNVLYDESSDRFILGVATKGGYYCAAVSQTGDPTGSWNIYSFQTASGAEFFDFPHAGVGRDAIYVGANIFENSAFKEGRIYALEKAAMYAGEDAAHVTRGLGSAYDSSQPLNLHGWAQSGWPASGPHYFISDNNYNGRTYAIHIWDDPFGANSFSLKGTVDLNAATGITAGMPLDAPQSGGGDDVDGGDWRPLDFEYRDGFGWTVMAIACNPGSGPVTCLRWAKIDLAGAAVADAGVYGSDDTYRFYGDLAVNQCGDMAVGYTKSSAAMHPGIWYTGRLSDDPAGTLQTETELKAGEITYTSFEQLNPAYNPYRRWGDYTGMTIDPDGKTFWYLGEYSKNTGTSNGRWGTYIGSFSYPECAGGAPVNDAPGFTKGADQTVPEDSGTRTVVGWATDISAGTVGQVTAFTVSNDNSGLFSVQPAITADGNLSYSPAANANGSATVTVTLKDDGGTAGGGADTSGPQSFIINVTAVNDAPGFTRGADQTVTVGAGPQTLSGWATAVSAGPADESGQVLNFTVSNDNNSLFIGQPSIAPNGTLSYTPASATGSATVTVALSDNGGTAGGGADTSPGQTFTITVNPVNVEPVVVFADSFENGLDLWTQDSQNDWFTRDRRATDGSFSAEVDGLAADAALISPVIPVTGKTQATVTFSWYIESGLDTGEYIAFDVSTDGGRTWVERASLRGNVDQENTTHNVEISVDITGAASLMIRFRATMSGSSEDANLDNVIVTVSGSGPAPNAVPMAVDDSNTTVQDSAVSGNVLVNDDQGDAPATVTAFDATSAQGGTVTMAGNGDYTYTPAAGFAGTDNFTYTITDSNGPETSAATVTITVNPVNTEPVVVFADSFENGLGLWTQDSQNRWFTRDRRATDGILSAEVDGSAADAAISRVIDLPPGKTQATITFSWYIESGLDAGEYVAFDVSTDGGQTWQQEASLQGNVDQEDTTHDVSVDVTGAASFMIRFRATMSKSSEDANLDNVIVTAR